MVTLDTPLERAVEALESGAPMVLGLAADALSRRLLAEQAGYHAPRHVRLTPDGPQSLGPESPQADHVRIVSLEPGVTLDSACRQVQQLRAHGGWVEGLQTHDLAALGKAAPARLQAAGLQRTGGSHAETFENGVRALRGVHDWAESLAWLERAAAAGLRLWPALRYGEQERPQQLVDRLMQVRALQQRCGLVDGIALVPQHERKAVETPGEISFGLDDMRLVSVARLLLGNVRHVQVAWLAFGFKAGTMALAFGADDLGPWCVDRHVTESAHLASYLAVREQEIVSAIEACGRRPQCWKGHE